MSLTLDIEGPVARLTLAVPPVNALDLPALEEIEAALERIEARPEIRVVILASGLDGLFCTGGDMKYWPRKYPDRPDMVGGSGQRVFNRLERLPQPVIGLIAGKVIGDGIGLALACDLRVAAKDSLFQLPEVDYGFIPGWGTVGRLFREAGRAATARMLLTGEEIKAAEALRLGLVHWVVKTGRVDRAVEKLAASLAAKPPRTLGLAKKALGDPADGALETECFKAVWGREEWRAGVERVFGTGPGKGLGE